MLLVASACSDRVAEPNPDYRPPRITTVGGVAWVQNVAARERLVVRRGLPDRPRFLFAGVRPAARDRAGRQAMLTPRGDRLMLFDRDGRFAGAVGEEALGRAVGVVPVRDGWGVVEAEGDVLLVDSAGVARRLFVAPFGPSTLAAFAGGLAAARSPFLVEPVAEPPGAPLIARLTQGGDVAGAIDSVRIAADPHTGRLINTGHLAAGDSLLYFVRFTEDGVRAYDRDGRLRWTTEGVLTPGRASPSFDSTLHFTPASLGAVVVGRFLYVLANADTAGRERRLDAYDARTGTLERTATMPADSSILAVDERGALYLAPAATLTARLPAPALTALEPFTLETFRGDSISLASLRGRVVLLNFWASWCAPCRAEFPMMNRLQREYAARGLTIVAVSEDVSEASARRFIVEMAPAFTVAKGGGRMAALVGYRGLPFTMLLDREGRIVSRFFGFGGRDQYRLLAREVETALRQQAR